MVTAAREPAEEQHGEGNGRTRGLRCMLMHSGAAKGAYFLAADLPSDQEERDDLLLRVMGSPDEMQLDGIGGGHSQSSKVAAVSRCPAPDVADVDFLFLQVHPDRPLVTAQQPCGNLLAGVGPFALSRGLVAARSDMARVRIRIVNTGSIATASFRPSAAADGGVCTVELEFEDIAGSVCGSQLPTGNVRDEIDGISVTCIDNGMPVVLVHANDLGVTGYETCEQLDSDLALAGRRERLWRTAGQMMGLGDTATASMPKITLIAAPKDRGTLAIRTFFAFGCHPSIGVLSALSVATAAMLPGSVAAGVATAPGDDGLVRLEHPSGAFDTRVISGHETAAVVLTTRTLFDGTVWPRAHRELSSAAGPDWG
jgi:4-oxalomesaconate tautomerase